MEVTSAASSAVGALRVGLQIVSTLKRPSMEVYHEIRNALGTEQEIPIRNAAGKEIAREKHRWQDISLSFRAINIGSVRAENVTIRASGNLRPNPPRDKLGALFETEIPSVAPGQALFLLNWHTVEIEGSTEFLDLTINYNGPNVGLNRIGRWWASVRKRKQYELRYRFDPRSIWTDLPPLQV